MQKYSVFFISTHFRCVLLCVAVWTTLEFLKPFRADPKCPPHGTLLSLRQMVKASIWGMFAQSHAENPCQSDQESPLALHTRNLQPSTRQTGGLQQTALLPAQPCFTPRLLHIGNKQCMITEIILKKIRKMQETGIQRVQIMFCLSFCLSSPSFKLHPTVPTSLSLVTFLHLLYSAAHHPFLPISISMPLLPPSP